MYKYTYLLKYAYVESPSDMVDPKSEIYYSCDELLEGSYVLEGKKYDSPEKKILGNVFLKGPFYKKYYKAEGWTSVKVFVAQKQENSYTVADEGNAIPYFEDEFYQYIHRLTHANNALRKGEDTSKDIIAQETALLGNAIDLRKYFAPLFSLGYQPITLLNDYSSIRQIFRSAIGVLIKILEKEQLAVSLQAFERKDLRLLQKELTDHLLLIQDTVFDLCDIIKKRTSLSIRDSFKHYKKDNNAIPNVQPMDLVPILRATQNELILLDKLHSANHSNVNDRGGILPTEFDMRAYCGVPSSQSYKEPYEGLVSILNYEETGKLYHSLLKYGFVDDSCTENDFVYHMFGNRDGEIPTNKILWTKDTNSLAYFLNMLHVNEWKKVSIRFITPKVIKEQQLKKDLTNTQKDPIETFHHTLKVSGSRIHNNERNNTGKDQKWDDTFMIILVEAMGDKAKIIIHRPY